MKNNIIIIVENYPGFGRHEFPELEKQKDCIIYYEDLSQDYNSSKNKFNLVRKKITFLNKVKTALFMIRHSNLSFSILKDNNYFKLKTAFQWMSIAVSYYEQIIKNNKIDKRTQLYSYWSSHLGITAALLQKKFNCKLITRMHGWDLYAERHGLKSLPFRELINSSASNIYFISQQGLNYYSAKYPNYVYKYKLNYLGTKNSYVFNPFHQKGTEYHIVSCSFAFKVKRLEYIAEAIAILYAQKVQIRWTHLGDGIEIEQIEKRISDFNIQSIVHIRKNLSNQDILHFYQHNPVDVFINASLSEGLPVSMMEAMSFGIPCIGPNVGGIPEIIDDGKNGYLLPSTPSAEEIANSLLQFHQLDDDQINSMRQAAFQTWKEKFDAEKNVKEFIEEILSL